MGTSATELINAPYCKPLTKEIEVPVNMFFPASTGLESRHTFIHTASQSWLGKIKPSVGLDSTQWPRHFVLTIPPDLTHSYFLRSPFLIKSWYIRIYCSLCFLGKQKGLLKKLPLSASVSSFDKYKL